MSSPLADVLGRVRRTPARQLPGKAARYALRRVRRRTRRWGLQLARGEVSDAAFLRALGGRFRTTGAAVAYFRGRRDGPRFFVADPADAAARARALAAHSPHLAARTRAAAEDAVAHVVDLLGSGRVSLGQRIDWLADFKTGARWPLQFYEDIDYIRLDQLCDVKVPWELSRCHHWVALGRAHALDPDPRYAREFVAQLESWLDANPWPYSVNWGRAMEVAVRAVNWLWAAALFHDTPELGDGLRLRLLKSLLQHGRHILDNLEYGGRYSGNHYLSNGVGLLFLGVLLPELREAAAWRRKGEEILWGEILRQVHPDGVDFEKGIGYQGLVAEFWSAAVRLCDLNRLPVPPAARERLERMFDFMLAYTRPDGTFPQVGDNDDGRLAGLDDEPPGTHRRHLAVGGMLFGRPDLLGAAGDAVETAVWLFGPAVLDAPRATPEVGSQAFPAGGFYVLRAPDAATLVDVGEVGMGGIGGHGHNDLLSFDLWAAGAPLVVDPGTYLYSGDPPARQALRATAAHNTVRVDGQEMARLGGLDRLWTIADDAHPTVLRWDSSPERDVLEAEHDGYTRLPDPVVHRRRITFDRRLRVWLVEDTLVGAAEHDLEVFFHLASAVAERDGLAVRLAAPRGDLWLVPLEPPADLALSVEDGWVSRAYGHRERAPVLRYALRVHLPVSLTFGLALVPGGAPLAEARRALAQSLLHPLS